jgi:Flp pilus assembly protein TadD
MSRIVCFANLGVICGQLGEFGKALLKDQECLKLNQQSGIAYSNLVSDYLSTNRLDEARTIAQTGARKRRCR